MLPANSALASVSKCFSWAKGIRVYGPCFRPLQGRAKGRRSGVAGGSGALDVG